MVWVLGQKALDQRLNLFGDIDHFRELGLRVEDSVEDIFLLGGIERRPSKEQFVEQDSQSIKINLIGMARST
jgi:hypothetical protein